MPTKRAPKITIRDPLLIKPYSPVYKPFPVPDILDICQSPRTTITFNCALIPYIIGALEIWAWEDSFIGTLEERNIAKGLFKDLQNEVGMAAKNCGCDDDILKIFRINPDTGDLEVSEDDGETWQSNPQSPYNQATYAPTLKMPNGANKKCKAANNVILNMKYLQTRYSGFLATINDIQELIVGVLTEGAAMLFLPVVGDVLVALLSPLLAKVIEGIQHMFGTTEVEYDAIFTEEAWETMLCILVCNGHDNGVYTPEDIVNIVADARQQLGTAYNAPGANMAAMIDYWGEKGTNNASRVGQGAIDNCDECGCQDCSTLDNWQVVYGTIAEQSAGYIRMVSELLPGGNQAVRLANWEGAGAQCCAVTYNIMTGVATNQAYYPCGSSDPIFSVPPAETCMWDIGVTNVFSSAFEIEFFFTECPP